MCKDVGVYVYGCGCTYPGVDVGVLPNSVSVLEILDYVGNRHGRRVVWKVVGRSTGTHQPLCDTVADLVSVLEILD